MDCSQLVLSVIKDETIKANLNPIVYYSIKLIYDPEFSKRSRFFCRAIRKFFDNLSEKLKLNEVLSSVPQEQKLNNNYIVNLLLGQISSNKENDQESDKEKGKENDKEKNSELLSNLFKESWSSYIDTLLDYDTTYILDKEEDYSLLYMIKDYIFETQDPKTSELMQGYNLFVSSVELMFCLRLVLHFPKIGFMRKEEKLTEKYYNSVTDRVKKFCHIWRKVYPEKYEKNSFIQSLIQNFTDVEEFEHKHIDFIALSLDEPILTPKYVGLIKLIREGPFVYEIEEIARQMCIIDHTNFSTIPQKDYIDYIVKKEIPSSFNKIYKREKHFKCYILMFLLLIKNLENQKNAIQNFINLAHQCKQLNNYQTSYAIISTFSAVGISKKELLWRLVEKKYRDIYQLLEHEYLDVDLNEKTFFDQLKSGTDTFVPHIDLIKNQINNFIIQIKMSNEEQKVKLCKEYRDFYSKIVDYNRNKYSFFLVNPLNDFLNSGFWEICKTKQWGIKTKFDFSSYADQESDAERLFDLLIKQYKKKDRSII